MIRFKDILFRHKHNPEIRASTTSSASITRSCLNKIREAILPEIQAHHEGVCYLLGLCNENSTVICSAVRPESVTTIGSFEVSQLAMAKVVRTASEKNLQVIGQFHTHPGKAYHSHGDDLGAPIAFEGFVSIVAPDYGLRLPSLNRAAFYRFSKSDTFEELASKNFKIIDPLYV